MNQSLIRNWHKIANAVSELKFGNNNLAEIEVNGKIICISLFGEHLNACAPKCPHAGAPLADGHMDALGHLVCPLHKFKFNPKNGRNVSGEGYHLKTYPVEIREDGVFINISFPPL